MAIVRGSAPALAHDRLHFLRQGKVVRVGQTVRNHG